MTTEKIAKQYFSHDLNARGDEKVIALMSELSMAGYGIYWVLIEKLFSADGYLEANYKLLAFDLRVDVATVKAVIEDFKLFKIDGTQFYSESVLRRLDIRRSKSGKASAAGKAKWDKEDQATNGFRHFWKAYPNKDGHDEALAAWCEKLPPLDKCLKALEWQAKTKQWQEHFIPKPVNYIIAGKWQDIPLGHDERECPACGNRGALRQGFKGKLTCGKCGHEDIIQ
jgi:ribosomal protein S27AE/uncharacterized protein YdaU (DUF1376 family)